MRNVIELRRRELVWETRISEYTEEDLERFKQWFEDFIGCNYPECAEQCKIALSHLNMNILFDYYNDKLDWEQDESLQVFVMYPNNNRVIDIFDEVEEDMREKNYNEKVSESDYADDFEEEYNCYIFED